MTSREALEWYEEQLDIAHGHIGELNYGDWQEAYNSLKTAVKEIEHVHKDYQWVDCRGLNAQNEEVSEIILIPRLGNKEYEK